MFGITPYVRRTIEDTADLADALKTRLDRMPEYFEDDRPWMKITARDTGTGYYAWTEQLLDPTTGTFVDMPTGRVGTVNGLSGATATILPAVEMNGAVIATFPVYVRGERFAEKASVGVIYGFAYPATGGASLIGTWTPSTQTVSSGGTFTYTSVLTATTAGLYLVSGVFNGQSTSNNNVGVTAQLLRNSTTSSAGFFHYVSGVFLPLQFAVGYIPFSATLTVTAADLVSGSWGIDVKLATGGGNFVVSNTAGYGLALVKIA